MLITMIQFLGFESCCAFLDSQQCMLPATDAKLSVEPGALQQCGCAGYRVQLYREARCGSVRQCAGRLRDLLILR